MGATRDLEETAEGGVEVKSKSDHVFCPCRRKESGSRARLREERERERQGAVGRERRGRRRERRSGAGPPCTPPPPHRLTAVCPLRLVATSAALNPRQSSLHALHACAYVCMREGGLGVAGGGGGVQRPLAGPPVTGPTPVVRRTGRRGRETTGRGLGVGRELVLWSRDQRGPRTSPGRSSAVHCHGMGEAGRRFPPRSRRYTVFGERGVYLQRCVQFATARRRRAAIAAAAKTATKPG